MMQRIVALTWSIGPVAALVAQAYLLSGCMSLRHKVDPVSITLNVKLEDADAEDLAPASEPTVSTELSTPPGPELTSR